MGIRSSEVEKNEARKKKILKERLAEKCPVLIKTSLPLATQETWPALSRINTKKITSRYIVVKLLGTEDQKGTVIRMMADLQSEAM